ncbi:hypothetical protein E4U57_002440 [Claviceps arundinis]|uniref:Uncharacterized protein n=1 Tax=Claviceps arundinis TaxID=1623583 RepID=A0ABQ7PP22_9HYPO|nr:hypothetical protein E4U57_002440 [Claviceps arundinis]
MFCIPKSLPQTAPFFVRVVRNVALNPLQTLHLIVTLTITDTLTSASAAVTRQESVKPKHEKTDENDGSGGVWNSAPAQSFTQHGDFVDRSYRDTLRARARQARMMRNRSPACVLSLFAKHSSYFEKRLRVNGITDDSKLDVSRLWLDREGGMFCFQLSVTTDGTDHAVFSMSSELTDCQGHW